MLNPKRFIREFPVGLFVVCLMLVGTVLYSAQLPKNDASHAAALEKADALLFDGISRDDPQSIRRGAAMCGKISDELGDILMNAAASGKRPRAVAELLKLGIPVNSHTLHGRTALISAAEIPGNSAMLRQLLDAGADPAAITCDGHTAITEARAIGDQQMVQLLIAAAGLAGK